MNESELNREQKVSKKILNFIDHQLEMICSNGNLTGADSKESTQQNSVTLEQFLELSKERRALIRQLQSHLKD